MVAPAAKAYLAAFYQHCDCILAPTLPMVAGQRGDIVMISAWDRLALTAADTDVHPP